MESRARLISIREVVGAVNLTRHNVFHCDAAFRQGGSGMILHTGAATYEMSLGKAILENR